MDGILTVILENSFIDWPQIWTNEDLCQSTSPSLLENLELRDEAFFRTSRDALQ